VRVLDDAYAAVDFSASQVRDGVVWRLYERQCTHDGVTTTDPRWFPDVTGVELGKEAYDSVRQLVPQPEVELSRPADDLIVNVETWIAVAPIQAITATASIPGLSATVIATPTRIDIVTGSQVRTDVQRLSCAPWGGAGTDCVWTPVYPSVAKVTGTNDHRHHGSVSIVWAVAWTSTDGTGGTLEELTTSLPMEFAVREIQIIGG
jgi:hypothetical protein